MQMTVGQMEALNRRGRFQTEDQFGNITTVRISAIER